MTRYDLLTTRLRACGQESLALSFSELEEWIGGPLPPSARRYSVWWANGGHSHAHGWLDAGYRVENVNLSQQQVSFTRKSGSAAKRTASPTLTVSAPPQSAIARDALQLCGYSFSFVQELLPELNLDGSVHRYYPQKYYRNEQHLPLLKNGDGAFCRFSVSAPAAPGVYVWVAGGDILYIGETSDLERRFNTGYGHISPRNCYQGGQSTNCRMNKVVLRYYEAGEPIRLYFLPTGDYKQVELELLSRISTPYNVKDNL